MEVFFRNHHYRIFMLANIISAIGSSLFGIVFVIYARHMPHPGLAISVASVAGSFPLLLDILMGYLADQTTNHFRQQLRNRLIQGLLYLIISLILLAQGNWPGFIIILSLSMLVSLISSYNTYGAIPIIKDIVVPKDISEAAGFEAGINATISITGGLIGAALLAAFHYHYSLFALVNAASFFLAFALLFHVRRHFAILASSQVVVPKQVGFTASIRHFFHQTRHNFKLLKQHASIIQFTEVFMAINLFDAGQEVLLNLSFAHQPRLLLINYGYTVALVGMVESVGSIVGSLLPGRLTRRFNIPIGIVLIYATYGLMPLNILFLKSRALLLLVVIVSSVLTGILNPQVQGKMINDLPKESIGSIISAFYTVVQLTVPLGSLIFATLANALSLKFSWIGLLVFDGGTFLLWLVQRRHQRNVTD
ncbi:MFS transporter [Levilactobacillus mulengensis]|uniref:MFS transporter n=1 Tax=Levilactobacillus mulengensis TaxID=2486025 RepID=UPI000F786517|nr:MFS transporter [Levilactobacillus mulengensis]